MGARLIAFLVRRAPASLRAATFLIRTHRDLARCRRWRRRASRAAAAEVVRRRRSMARLARDRGR